MNLPKTEIDQALIEVRKAYRLLHDYQRAALDAIHYVETQLGFRNVTGHPTYSDTVVGRGKGVPFSNWAWDWLHMMLYDFHSFAPKDADGRGLNMSIWLISDTGYFLSENSGAEKTKVGTYAKAEISGTKVAFLFYWQWSDRFDQFKRNRNEVRHFLETNGDLPAVMTEGGVRGKCFDFSRLSDEQSTDALIDEVIRWCNGEGFPLERVQKVG